MPKNTGRGSRIAAESPDSKMFQNAKRRGGRFGRPLPWYHIHVGRNVDVTPVYNLLECRCGRRATTKFRRGYSPLPKGWPRPEDGWV